MPLFDDGFQRANLERAKQKMAAAKVAALYEARKKLTAAIAANHASAFGTLLDADGNVSFSIDGMRSKEDDKVAAIDRAIQEEWASATRT